MSSKLLFVECRRYPEAAVRVTSMSHNRLMVEKGETQGIMEIVVVMLSEGGRVGVRRGLCRDRS